MKSTACLSKIAVRRVLPRIFKFTFICCASILSIKVVAKEAEEVSLDQIVVTATRNARLIRDEVLHVEAVPSEEIEENLTVLPGNVSSLLNELPGVRFQSTAPGLGGMGLQLRGIPSRHTLVLIDGLPLLGSDTGGFGLLQTPPLDLEHVEVIKGAASALYGGSSSGGVLNLVSRRSSAEPEVLANATSRGGQDLVGFVGNTLNSRWSGTISAGAHWQSREDVDDDGWADIPAHRRFVFRPRVWWSGDHRNSTFLTAGIVSEARTGGTLSGRLLPSGSPFEESLTTQRWDAGLVNHWSITDSRQLSTRASYTSTKLERKFGNTFISTDQTTAFIEESMNGSRGKHKWVMGVAFGHDRLAAASVPGVSYSYDVPAVFVQDDYSPMSLLTFAGSLRFDAHNVYGNFLSPRLSMLVQAPEQPWSLRASIGSGFSAPTPFVDEIDATGLVALYPLQNLRAERATTTSIDARWSDHGWDVNVSVFDSQIRHSLIATPTPDNKYQLMNAPGPRRAPGAEVLIGYVAGPLHTLASWTYLDVTEEEVQGQRQRANLIPRHAAELAAIIESEQRGRIGLEVSYTGTQKVDSPYLEKTPAIYEVNALGEIRFGEVAIFLNVINITDERQTHYEPLLRPTLGVGGNPLSDVWSSLEGRTFNLGIRAEM